MHHKPEPRIHTSALSRRQFVRRSALYGMAATFLPQWLLADPYQPYALLRPQGEPLRIRGVVRSGGRGVAGVPVTDGISIVDTAPDGTFELISSTSREHVYLSLPSGYRIPTNGTGTARFYQPIEPGLGNEMAAEFTLERSEGGDENHTMLLLADIQAQTAEEMALFHGQTVPDIQATLRALGDEQAFAMACGDIVFDDLTFFSEYERAVRKMGIPAFQVVVFWYSAGYLGYLDAEQLTWLQEDLRRVEAGRPVVISLHIPVEGTRDIRMGAARPVLAGSVSNREFLYRMVEPYATHFLSGHTHDAEHLFLHGTHAQVSGTVCGAWWTGPICGDGTPNGYGVYEARGEEIRWRYKATGFDDAHQIRAYPRGAVPGAPDEVVANVWNWDPDWQVLLYEGADRRGPMAGRVERDPLAVELYGPEQLPAKRPWVEPFPTRHLFFAPVDADHGDLRVVAVDRFGREYSTSVPVNVTTKEP